MHMLGFIALGLGVFLLGGVLGALLATLGLLPSSRPYEDDLTGWGDGE